MGMDEKLVRLEKMTKEIEAEKNFDKVVGLFSQAAELVKEVLAAGVEQKGKVLEIIREMDEWTTKEVVSITFENVTSKSEINF